MRLPYLGRCVTGLLLGSLLASAAHAQQPSAGVSLAEAKRALAASEAAAAKMGIAETCAVVDSRGDPILLQRMDTARFFTVKIALGKARASAAFGAPTASLAGMANTRLDQAIDGEVFFLQGAVPITRNGQLSGAIGCSGGSGQQDEDAAKAGLAAL